MSTRVLAYRRVSTEEQASSGAGLGAQRAALEAEAASRGWADVSWVADEGWSAKDLRRPGITSALDELEAGRAEVLAVAKLDRLSRSVHDFIGIVERARRQGWELVCLDPPFDLATPAGELMANMLVCFAQFERRLIGQRIREALAVKRTQGVRLGRRSTLDPEAVERVVELRADGLSWRAIAEAMTEEGWPTGQGGNWAPSVCRLLWLRATEAEAKGVA